jgi:general secretion pathway protein A
MYEELFGHFGLARNPFVVSPDPTSFYSTLGHDEALLQLAFGVKTRQGLMVLTGEPGTGKTILLHCFVDWLRQRERYSAAYIFHTLVCSTDLLQLILKEFGIACDCRSKGDMVIALMGWLSERCKRGDCPVIVIDEAQGLSNAALEEVRLLLNAEMRGAKLVQIVLAGQLQLEEKLRHPHLAQLRQRMMCYWRLRPLTEGETAGYIVKRLESAGSNDVNLIPPETVREIYWYSKGVPRVINLLGEHALLSAYADGRKFVDISDVASVAKQFELDEEARSAEAPSQAIVFRRLKVRPKFMLEDTNVHGTQAEERVAAATAAVVAQQEEEKEAALTGAAQATVRGQVRRAEPSTFLIPRRQPVLALVKASSSRVCSEFLNYWRVIGDSLVRDAQQFIEPVRDWLTPPDRSRLWKPESSTAIVASRTGKPSAAWKRP